MLHTSRQPFPPDIRIEKEARALAAAGHSVIVQAWRNDDGQAEREELEPGIEVRRARVGDAPPMRRLLRRLTLQSPEWYGPLAAAIADHRPHTLHVHDLVGLPTALRVAGRPGLPVVADFHENMPAALRAYRAAKPAPKRLGHAVGYNYHLWRWHEMRCARACARVIVVVPEAAERFLIRGFHASRLVVVSNTEDETTFPVDVSGPIDGAVASRLAGTSPLVYVGGVGPERGLDTVVAAMPALLRAVPSTRLVVVGASRLAAAHLHDRADAAGVAESVDLLGWQPFHLVKDFMLASAVCLVPHADFEHTQTTVPHKLFQYMSCARPVIVSDVRPLARIVGEAGCGLIFRAGDPFSFAEQAVRLLRDPALAAALGERGRDAALGRFAWRHDARRLVEMYRGLEGLA